MDDPLAALAAGLEDGDTTNHAGRASGAGALQEAGDQAPDPFMELAEEVEKAPPPRAWAAAPAARAPPGPPRPAAQPGSIPISGHSLTAQQAAEAAAERQHRITAFRRPAAPPTSSSAPRTFTDLGQGSLIERHSGLKVKNPVVSASQMESRLAHVNVIRLSHLRSRNAASGLGSAWCTLCALGERSPARASAAGNAYSVWKLTDLDSACVSLFLFGAAHSELRREGEGTLVAVFGAKVRAEGGEFSLSVERGEQVLVLGRAAQFGYCKAAKKNGDPCRVPVNLGRCPYCPYHVAGEFQKMAPRRIELQGGQLKSAFRPGMQSALQWAPGQFQRAEAAARPRMPAATLAQMRGAAEQAAGRGSAAGARYVRTVADPGAAKAAAAEVETAKLHRNKMCKGAAPIPLARTSEVVAPPPPSRGAKRAAGAAGAAAGGGRAGKRAAGGAAREDADSVTLLEEDDIFEATTGGAARQRAIEILRAAGGERALAPAPRAVPAFLAAPLAHMQQQQRQQQQQPAAATAATTTAAPRPQPPRPLPPSAAQLRGAAARGGAALAARPLGAHNPAPPRDAARQSAHASKSKPATGFAAAFGSVIQEMQSDAAAAAAGSGSIYAGLAEDEEEARLGRVIDALAARDEAAQKMDSVTRLEVTAWRCAACEYTAERRRDACARDHPEATARVAATKRWWECGNGACRHRFSTVGVRYPPGRCAKCDLPGGEFRGVSMLRPQRQAAHERGQSAVAGRDALLARGTEQKWVMG